MIRKIVGASISASVIALGVGVFSAVTMGTIMISLDSSGTSNPAIGPFELFVMTFLGQILLTFLAGVTLCLLPTFFLFLSYALLLIKFAGIRGPMIGVASSILISCTVLVVVEIITRAIMWNQRIAILVFSILCGILVGTQWVRRKVLNWVETSRLDSELDA